MMKTKLSGIAAVLLPGVLLLAAGTASAQTQVNPLGNGEISVDMPGCSILFDQNARIRNKGLDCDSSDERAARNALNTYNREQGASDSYDSSSHSNYGSHGNNTTVTCESKNGQYQFCRHSIPRNASVTVQRRLSDRGCNKGQDWDYEDEGIWVQDGCRATFLVTSSGGSHNSRSSSGSQVTCESKNGQHQYCHHSIPRGAQVSISRRLSDSGCNQGQDWGYDNDGVWVQNGCRAVFEIR